ncbi:hypothetical protein [Streptomyces sp. NPDC059256]|uniref:hypothetical protein n=1 Tax=Streptomyces sp. NPDC059256 TaxID=3346794 RepID=UPI0036C18134
MVTPVSALPSRPTYWCEATAQPTTGGNTCWLGSYMARSPRLALRWFTRRVRDVTDQLDPHYAAPGRHWLTDHTEHERARTSLAEGEMYTLTLHDDTARYVLSARPTGTTR